MSTSVGLAHDTGWDQTQILSNLYCVSKERWKSRIKRTIRIEVWENRIKRARAEQMEEAAAVWPAWKVHFTCFKSQTHTDTHTHTHTYTTLKASLKARLLLNPRAQSIWGISVSQSEFLFTQSLKAAFPSSILSFYLCPSSFFSVIKYSSQSLCYYVNRPETSAAPCLSEMPLQDTWPRSLSKMSVFFVIPFKITCILKKIYIYLLYTGVPDDFSKTTWRDPNRNALNLNLKVTGKQWSLFSGQ